MNFVCSTIETSPIHYGWGLPPNDKVTTTPTLPPPPPPPQKFILYNVYKHYVQQLRQVRYIMVGDCHPTTGLHNISAHLHNALKLNNN